MTSGEYKVVISERKRIFGGKRNEMSGSLTVIAVILMRSA